MALCFGVLALLLAVFFSGLCYQSAVINTNRDAAYELAERSLQLSGYTVLEGQINSPTVIETTRSYGYFASLVSKDLPVYHVLGGGDVERYVAVFNATYGLAYYPSYVQVGWWGL